jgi:hypothetical protein
MMENVVRGFGDLIDLSLNSEHTESFEVSMTVDVDGQTLNVYEAIVSYRDIMLVGDLGVASYAVDSYGDRHTVELIDWDLDENN